MAPNDKSDFLGTAFRAALFAGAHIEKNLGKISRGDIGVKQASDFVTRVDKESELIIIDIIRKKFPAHHFYAEESLKEDESAGYRWIIDPLDGTSNFIHEYPVFSVSIALEHGRDIILGVVYDPLRNEIFTAEKGKGTFLNGRRVSVSSTHDLKDSLIATGFPFRRKELIGPYLDLFRDVFDKVSDIRRAGSAALDLAYLASGRCEGFFEIGLSPWDIAAGSILIKEAGGIVTDFAGGHDYLTSGNIVAGVPAVHNALLNDVRKTFKDIISK